MPADLFPKAPLSINESRQPSRQIAPISTVLFVAKSHQPDPSWLAGDVESAIPQESNLPADKHWTDFPPSGSIVLLQQPPGQTCALLGDIVGTRLKASGLAGVIVDGRTRDVAGCSELSSDGNFCVWTKGLAVAGTSLEAKPWAVDVPVRVGSVVVRPGDFVMVDEAEKGLVVIPKEKLKEVAEILPGLKEADDGVLEDVKRGLGLREAFQRHPGHYTHLA